MRTSWPEMFFNVRYLDMFMTRTPERRRFEAGIIRRYAELDHGSRVADFCCGIGDVLHTLKADYGIDGEGVELAADYVDVARQVFPNNKVYQGDAMTFALAAPFDAVINWNSSFGYFDPHANQLLLENMARHTKPGGRLLIEMYHSTYIREHFSPVLDYVRAWRGREYQVTRTSRFSADQQQLHQHWRFRGPEGEESFDTNIQLYSVEELRLAVQRAGFAEVRLLTPPTPERPVWDEPLSAASPRLLLVARKP